MHSSLFFFYNNARAHACVVHACLHVTRMHAARVCMRTHQARFLPNQSNPERGFGDGDFINAEVVIAPVLIHLACACGEEANTKQIESPP